MKIFAIFLTLTCLSPLVVASDPTLVYLVRHAEKVDTSRDPDLSEQGYRRAAYLNHFFETIALDTIYSSEFKRTRDTVKPLAKTKGMEVTEVPASQPERLVDLIKANPGKTILVSGHSNTLPDLIKRLAGPSLTIDESQYDNLFLLILTGQKTLCQQFQLKLP